MTGEYKGDYDIQYLDDSYDSEDETVRDNIKLFNTQSVMTYSAYEKFCTRWNLEQKYHDEDMDYAVIAYKAFNSSEFDVKLANVVVNDGKTDIYLWESADGFSMNIRGYFLVVPLEVVFL